MKSNIELLSQYKEEKALVVGDVESRTGLEPFPTFKEWKVKYIEEYQATHRTVDVKKADEIMEAAVAEADAELEELTGKLPAVEVKPEPKKAPAKKKAAKRAGKKSVVKKTSTKKRVAKKAPARKSRAKSKSAKAQTIFAKFYGRKTRAEIIGKFVAQVKLTPNGAATYYQKFKKAAG